MSEPIWARAIYPSDDDVIRIYFSLEEWEQAKIVARAKALATQLSRRRGDA